MKMINSWRANAKQKDKFHILVRISSVTVFELSIDISDRFFRLVIMNVGIE